LERAAFKIVRTDCAKALWQKEVVLCKRVKRPVGWRAAGCEGRINTATVRSLS
jgi:hypothetical protein